MKRLLAAGLLPAIALIATLATPASARPVVKMLTPAMQKPVPGAKRLTFRSGPYLVRPGANLILIDKKPVPHPGDGYITRIAPNLRYAVGPGHQKMGAIPRVDVIHLHHGVWLSNGAVGSGQAGNGFDKRFYPFFAAGEEKTTFILPKGYGYPIQASDRWTFNYMIHDLTPNPAYVWVTYTLDWIPANSAAAKKITPAHPIWNDVQRGSLYPVFDVKQGSGTNGRYTYPNQANNPYGKGTKLNEITLRTGGTLLDTAGHLHPGGLWDELDLIRPGAHVTARKNGPIPGEVPNSVRLFRSYAHYFDPRGPISWDMAMGATAPDWRVNVNAGDTLRISATYDTKRASWYEVMGIMVLYMADNVHRGVNPFTHTLDQTNWLTHGHLAENRHHGGTPSGGYTALRALKACKTTSVKILKFQYLPGDLSIFNGPNHCAPTVKQGQSVTFTTEDAHPLKPGELLLFESPQNQPYLSSIFHTVTSCKAPCGLDTGISYPLADGSGRFDSAELGQGTPASGSFTWNTPTNLKPGTYTYFCRIHPFMRGVFRVVKQ